jgi:glycosyltransferase involved in cell wall biosynthesis
MKFSVLMSVYIKESPLFFKDSLNSIYNQTLLPDEVVLIKDGPLTFDLEKVIDEFVLKFINKVKVISLSENKGLGNALSIGVLECSNDLIARMDSDDICVLDRFEKQIDFLIKNPKIDLLGTNIEEFNIVPGDLNRLRVLPQSGIKLIKFSKFRNPINHPTIMFRKEKVIAVGNYQSDILLFEDYSLFIRMIRNNANFYNIQEPLLFFRVGRGIETIKRRSGFNYLKNEWKFSLLSLKIGHINFFEWLFYIFIKLPFRMLPPRVVLFVYNKFLRN